MCGSSNSSKINARKSAVRYLRDESARFAAAVAVDRYAAEVNAEIDKVLARAIDRGEADSLVAAITNLRKAEEAQADLDKALSAA